MHESIVSEASHWERERQENNGGGERIGTRNGGVGVVATVEVCHDGTGARVATQNSAIMP